MNVPMTKERVSARPASIRGRRSSKRAADRPLAKIVPDRRKYRRVAVSLDGRFMADGGAEVVRLARRRFRVVEGGLAGRIE